MKSFYPLVTLVCMAIVVGSQGQSYNINMGKTGAESMLDISCPEGTVLTVIDAWFGNSENCTQAIADQPIVGDSRCCKNVFPKMEGFITGYEDYYGDEGRNALINWVSTDYFGDDCPGVAKNLWVAYLCVHS